MKIEGGIEVILTSLLRICLTRSLKPFEFSNTPMPLDFMEVDKLGLYIHIPFCKSICSFCPYCKVLYDRQLAVLYKSALLKEITLAAAGYDRKKEVSSLYFGGGTPALMIDDIKDIICQINQYFIIQNGIGIELHPRDVSVDNLQKLKEAGVTMISIGIQSFNGNCLMNLGREHPDYGAIFSAINEVKFDVIDMDLIFGIPGQDWAILKEDIKTAFENGATQISTYPFIDFTFINKNCKPLPEKDKKKMLDEINHFTSQGRYERTSIWTFAKPQTTKYSSITRDNFLGFGVSATTLLQNQFKINTFSIDAYVQRLSQNELPTSLTLKFTLSQRMVYYLFWSAYSMQIDAQSFKKFFGRSIGNKYGIELLVGTLLGYIIRRRNKYFLTDRGAYLFHKIEQRFTGAYIEKMWNISRISAFPKKIVLK